jgi:hypothetical protein
MKPFSRSVIELFDGKKRYAIPMFQRQYAWREDRQLGRIWVDLKARTELRLDNKTTSPHFLGAIVISLLPTFGRQVQAYDVIDGQQRLTTFQVLLNAFRDVARALESEFADELNKYIVNEGIMEDKSVERYKVWPTQVDRSQMKALVDSGSQAGVAAMEKAELGKNKTGVEPIMISAYHYFYNQIRGFVAEPSGETTQNERIEALFNALKHDLALVAIELEGGDDPQVIFETLNGFNEPLLPTDLMRNFVFQRAYREKRGEGGKTPDDLYNEYWLPFDHHFWKCEEKQGRLKRPRVDLFFQHFLAMKQAIDINVARLYHDYKIWIETDKPYASVEDELKDTVHFAWVYKKMITPEEPSELSDFAGMLNIFDVKTITPLILFVCGEVGLQGEPLRLALLSLESFLIRRAVCGLTTKNYNRLFLQLVEGLRGKADVESALKTALHKGEGDAVVWPDDASFSLAWLTRKLYKDMPSIRLQFILKRIEQAKRSAKNEDIHIKSALTIEHVMPVTWETHWSLSDGRMSKSALDRIFDEEPDPIADKRDQLIHTIGNLTLLTQPLNSSIQNGAWGEKQPKITKQSALALNREFVDYPEWNETKIEVRSRELLGHALRIWPQ